MEYLIIFLISILPWIELRGAIPVGIFVYGMNPITVFTLSVFSNLFVYFIVYFGLDMFYDRFKENKFINHVLLRIRTRARPSIQRYGPLGLMLFVAFPFPITGAWTGSILAWFIGMDKIKGFVAIAGGIILAGVIVTLLSIGALEGLSLLI
jgi:uncharacterized membrane protein